MADPIRGLPDVTGGGIVRPSPIQGGREALASAEALNAISRSAAQIGSSLKQRADERQRQRDRDAAATLQGQVTVEPDEEGVNRLRGLEQAMAIEDPDIRRAAIETAATSAARNAYRERITQVQTDFPLDVEAQEAALIEARDQLLEGLDPIIAGPVGQELDARMFAAVDAETRRKAQVEVQNGLENIQGDIDALIRERDQIIRQYGPEAASELEEYARVEMLLEGKVAELSQDVYGLSEADIDGVTRGAELSRDLTIATQSLDAIITNQGFDAAYESAREISHGMDLSTEEAMQVEQRLMGHVGREFTRQNRARIEQERREAEADRVTDQAQRTQFNALLRGVADGSATLADVEAARESGGISDDQFTRIYVSEAADQAEQAALMARLDSGAMDPNNADDRDAVDALFNAQAAEMGGLAALEGEPAAMMAVGVAMAQEYGIVPETLESRLRARGMSTNPDVAMPALDMIAALEERAPGAAGQAFSAELAGDARVYANAVANGVDPLDAFNTLAASRDQSNAAGRDIRQERARDLVEDINVGTIEKLYNREDGFFERNPSLSAPMEADAALSTYRGLFRDAYVRFGDEDSARVFAETAVRRSFGVSRLSGRPQIMRNPPEAFYPDYGDGGQWMREQLAEAVSTEMDMPGVEAGSVMDRVQLIPDRQTARDVQSGRAPTYSVVVEREDGVMQTIDGRWMFDDRDLRDAERERQREEFTAARSAARQVRELLNSPQARASGNQALQDRAVRDWLGTDMGGGSTAVGRFDRWRDQNPDAPATQFPGLLAPSMFEAR